MAAQTEARRVLRMPPGVAVGRAGNGMGGGVGVARHLPNSSASSAMATIAATMHNDTRSTGTGADPAEVVALRCVGVSPRSSAAISTLSQTPTTAIVITTERAKSGPTRVGRTRGRCLPTTRVTGAHRPEMSTKRPLSPRPGSPALISVSFLVDAEASPHDEFGDNGSEHEPAVRQA